MNLNIRNRRQKILHNLSFETEICDIYDPVFTSEEDTNSDDSSSSGSQETSSYASEEQGATTSSINSGESFEQFRGDIDTNSNNR